MSLCVPLVEIEDKMKRHIYRKLKVKEKVDASRSKSAMYRNLKEITPYRLEDDHIYLPFHWSFSKPCFQAYRRQRTCFDTFSSQFNGNLRDEQKTIQTEAIQHLNHQGSILIACFPGFGKTITTLSISSKIGLKTLVLVNRVILIDQWVASIKNFFQEGVRVQVLGPNTEMEQEADFYIMNAINTEKRNIVDYNRIGLVIVDECHLMITSVFVRALSYACPRYLIGLSATPFRPDGLDVLLDIYFGTERIVREMFRRHIVYKVNTNIVMEGEENAQGTLDWNSVLQKQMSNPSRNNFIKEVCLFFKTRNILVLCKRVAQVKELQQLLSTHTPTSTLKGSENEFDTECRVLIATVAKVGVGFSFDKLDMLVLACDLKEYYLQFVGRVFRKPEVVPIIIDIVDKNPVLFRHFKCRLKVYQECGGSVYDFRSTFPDFPLSFS